MKLNNDITWRRVQSSSLDLKDLKVAIVGGTGGIGRAIARLMASRGADVTVVGQTFRDAEIKGITFLKADLSLMREAQRVGKLIQAESLDLILLTTGIFAAFRRQETSEGIERDMATSYLSRLVILSEMAGRLGKQRPGNKPKPRVFIMGFPGTGQVGTIKDLNAEKSYGSSAVHMSTVAGNEMLVLDAAKRHPHANFYGLNPGIIRTNIRSNFFGEGTLQFKLIESIIGVLTPGVDTYAARITPLLVSPDIENHSGAMFNNKGQAILPSKKLTESYTQEFITASAALVKRAGIQIAS